MAKGSLCSEKMLVALLLSLVTLFSVYHAVNHVDDANDFIWAHIWQYHVK